MGGILRRPPSCPAALAFAAAAGEAVVVPRRYLVHGGAHRTLAGIGAGIHCAGAADGHACVGRGILQRASTERTWWAGTALWLAELSTTWGSCR